MSRKVVSATLVVLGMAAVPSVAAETAKESGEASLGTRSIPEAQVPIMKRHYQAR